jgi:cytochrome b subunit of formate dehydrogenase/nitrate/TMAO reductase-like tetraheme cytochrome c subunit
MGYSGAFLDFRLSRMMTKTPTAVFVVLLAGVILLAPWPLGAQTCSDCHENKPGSHTAHEQVDCANCHIEHAEFPHSATATTVTCEVCHSQEADRTALGVHGQERQRGNEAAPDCGVCHGRAHDIELPGTTRFRRATVETCGMCHSEEAEQFQQSVHGSLLANQTTREGPTCNTCHGEHQIQRPADLDQTAGVGRVRDTCASCHADVELMSRFGLPTDRVVSFDASFHGLALRAGSQTVANCGSCHGIHAVLPSSDPRSTVSPAKLAETCGQCHPGAGTRFQISSVHQNEGSRPVLAAQLIEQVYLVLIPLTIGLMLLHHAGDWVRKTRLQASARMAVAAVRPMNLEMRMHRAERIQHGLLIVSFLTLAWTGFALRYPGQFWAYPLVMWEGSWPVRGIVHRIAGVVMITTSVVHVFTLIANRRLREHWLHLLPRRWDLGEALAGFAYNVGLRRAAPRISAHSYIEKVEYWAVVWGTVMMGVSGVLLWADNFVLRHFPKGLLDVAGVFHYYEAVLAALAILVWHFYSVIFDPSVYPMNLAWLTGFGPSRNDSAETPAAAPRSAATPGSAAARNLEPHAPPGTATLPKAGPAQAGPSGETPASAAGDAEPNRAGGSSSDQESR